MNKAEVIKEIVSIIINENFRYSGDTGYFLDTNSKAKINDLLNSTKGTNNELVQFISENLPAFQLFGIDLYPTPSMRYDILYNNKQLVV